MAIAITLKNYLDSMGVPYEVVPHAPTHSSLQTARAARVPPDHLAKPVILEDENGYLMAVVPSNRQVRLGELSKQLSRHLRLATENELRDLFRDCALGAIPPLGPAYGLETVMDDSLPLQDDVWFEAGDHEELIHMQGAAFAALMQRARRPVQQGPIGAALRRGTSLHIIRQGTSVTASAVSHYFDAELLEPLASRRCRSGCRIGGCGSQLAGDRAAFRGQAPSHKRTRPTSKIVQ